MKILHVSNKPVYPPVDGGCAASAALLRSLTQVSENVHHCTVVTAKHPFCPEAYPAEMSPVIPVEYANIDTSVRVTGALSALLRRQNYNLARFFSSGFEKALRALQEREHYECVVLESLFLACYIPVLRTAGVRRIIIRTHNVEHVLWEQQSNAARGLKKWYLKQLAGSLKREEVALLNTADELWAITREDAESFDNLGIKTKKIVVPVALQIPEESPVDYEKNCFFHLGSLNWEPNRRAVERLLRIWPVFAQATNAELHIAGSFGEAFQHRHTHIKLHGFVENSTVFMQQHGCLLTPVDSGSGVRMKLLEALSLGIPCVSTRLGAAGIEHPENCMLLAETDEEWLTQLRMLHQSPGLRRELGKHAQAYIRQKHSFVTVNAIITQALGS